MNKIVFSLVCAVLFMGCTNVYVTAPNVDADMEDGGTVLPPDASVDALMQPDSSVTADAGMDATPDVVVVPDVCTGETDCCHAGQPIRAGLTCGDYPDSAGAICNAVGVCYPQMPQTCDLITACCDGWRPRPLVTSATPCHCPDPTGELVAPGYTGCSQDPARQDDGPGAGRCVLVAYEITCALPYTP